MVKRRSPSPDDFDEQMERFTELASIDGRLASPEAHGSERSRLRRRRDQILSAIRGWNLRFLWPGRIDGNGAES